MRTPSTNRANGYDERELDRLEVCIYTSPYPVWGFHLQFDPYVFPTAEERAEMRRRLNEWEAAGNFVFWWGRDYNMSPDGCVIAE